MEIKHNTKRNQLIDQKNQDYEANIMTNTCYEVILDTKRVEIKVLNKKLEKKTLKHIELSKAHQKDKDKGVKRLKKHD